MAQKPRDHFIHTGNIIWIIPNNADEALKFCSPADSFRSRSIVERVDIKRKEKAFEAQDINTACELLR